MQHKNSHFTLLFLPVFVLAVITHLFVIDTSPKLPNKTTTHSEFELEQDIRNSTYLENIDSASNVTDRIGNHSPLLKNVDWNTLFNITVEVLLGDRAFGNTTFGEDRNTYPTLSRLNTYRAVISYQHYTYGLSIF